MASGTFTYVSETRAKGRAEGRAAGRAEGVLRILQHRGIPVSDSERGQIESCTDLGTLETWLDRAFEVSKAEDLFTS